MTLAAVGCPVLAFKNEFGQAVIKRHLSPRINPVAEFAPLVVNKPFNLATVRIAMADEALSCLKAKLEYRGFGLRWFAPVASVAGDGPMRPAQGIGRLIVL
jgi:hypothetical protein